MGILALTICTSTGSKLASIVQNDVLAIKLSVNIMLLYVVNEPAVSSVAKRAISVREVWASIRDVVDDAFNVLEKAEI